MEQRIEKLEKAFQQLTAELSSISGFIVDGFKKVDHNFDSIQSQINSLHKKLDSANQKLDKLEGNTIDGFDGVNVKLENLTDEIQKISNVTGYEGQIDNLNTLIK